MNITQNNTRNNNVFFLKNPKSAKGIQRNWEKHQFHLVANRQLPFLMSMSTMLVVLSIVFYWPPSEIETVVWVDYMIMHIAFIMFAFTMLSWFIMVVHESQAGHHTTVVQQGLRLSVVLFIVSKVMFFFAFFWAYSSLLDLTVELKEKVDFNTFFLTTTLLVWPHCGTVALRNTGNKMNHQTITSYSPRGNTSIMPYNNQQLNVYFLTFYPVRIERPLSLTEINRKNNDLTSHWISKSQGYLIDYNSSNTRFLGNKFMNNPMSFFYKQKPTVKNLSQQQLNFSESSKQQILVDSADHNLLLNNKTVPQINDSFDKTKSLSTRTESQNSYYFEYNSNSSKDSSDFYSAFAFISTIITTLVAIPEVLEHYFGVKHLEKKIEILTSSVQYSITREKDEIKLLEKDKALYTEEEFSAHKTAITDKFLSERVKLHKQIDSYRATLDAYDEYQNKKIAESSKRLKQNGASA